MIERGVSTKGSQFLECFNEDFLGDILDVRFASRITPNQPEQAARSDPYARYGRQGLGGRMPGGMAQRYGYGLRPTPPPVTTPVPSGPKRAGTVVDEQKLEIVLSLDTVRLRPAPKVAKAATPTTPLTQTGTESAR